MADTAELDTLNAEVEQVADWATRLHELIAEIDSKLLEMRGILRSEGPDPSLN